jgi:CubicO group peptidase (beta-lactamase class C family)
MSHGRKAALSGWVMALLWAAAARAAEPAGLDAIAPKMQEFVNNGQISGIVTLVADKDQVFHKNAVGTSDGMRKMLADDIFWIASMSKPVTAVAAGILVDEGKLKWDDPVEKYIPEFKSLKVGNAAAAPSRPVQVRDLLTHVSGLPEYARTEPHWTLEQFAKQIASQPLRFQPGTRWQYSTAGIDAAGRVVEVASGMPFDAFLQKRVFGPLQMKDTSFWITPETEKRYARAWVLNAQTGKLEETKAGYMYGTEVNDRQRAPLGGAGLFSTAEDMARFYQMMLQKGTRADATGSVAVLKPETVAEMTKNQIGALTARPGMAWGYGFCVIIDPKAMEANAPLTAGTFGHGGAFGTSSWADPAAGAIYVQMLERDKMGNPDNSPMHIAFNQVAAKAMEKK